MTPTNIRVHRFAVFTSGMTVLLLCAGALVTGTGSGLSVPDWPLSYGQFFPPMVGGILFEHGHRMIAGTVAILFFALTFSILRTESRAWVRNLALAGVGVVLCQATLGGLTVLLRLPKPVSIAHACLAQIFFCITVVLAMVTGPSWSEAATPLEPEEGAWISFPSLCLLTSFGFFLQLVLGATMRHMKAGLAIPDFPLAFGGIMPHFFTAAIAVHYAHRVGAFVMVALVAWLVVRVQRKHSDQLGLVTMVGVVASLIVIQGMLGASVIWLKRPIPLTTAHLVVGALTFASSVALTFGAFRVRSSRLPRRPVTSSRLSMQLEPG